MQQISDATELSVASFRKCGFTHHSNTHTFLQSGIQSVQVQKNVRKTQKRHTGMSFYEAPSSCVLPQGTSA